MDLAATTVSPTDRDNALTSIGALMITLDTIPDPLHRLQILTTITNMIDGETMRTVNECRVVDVPWALIADATGLNSKQAAQYRYGRA